jgi:hypothetical protein
LSAQKTWLFSGKFDTVVELRYAQALSEKIGLEEEHHVIMACDHYSGILQLPQLIFRMRETLAGQPFEIEEGVEVEHYAIRKTPFGVVCRPDLLEYRKNTYGNAMRNSESWIRYAAAFTSRSLQ